MTFFSLLPRRCLCCGDNAPLSALCVACEARHQTHETPDPGLGHCPICGQVRLAESDRCMDCSTQSWSFPVLVGQFGYQDPGGELLRLYKFAGLVALAPAWARWAAAKVTPPGPLVPVPPLRKHLWKRGWDPVQTFSQALSRQTGLPVWKVLVRRPSASQKRLDREKRLENARRAYELAPGVTGLSGVKLVWLVDDVVTTGATVEACAWLLRQAGVAEVRVICLGLH